MAEVIHNRYDFVVLFDVTNGNPNGRSGCGEYAARGSGNGAWPCDRCLPET